MIAQPDPFAEAPASTPSAMSDDALAALLAEHARRCIGHFNSEIAGDQEESIDFYYRRPMGDERAGRSSVVDGTVAAVVDNALAALLKPFASADQTVSYLPRGPEDVGVAEQATDYANFIFHSDNPGFLILHDWFKDALLTKLGVIKIWWHDQSADRAEELSGLDAGQVEMLIQTERVVAGPWVDEQGLYALSVMRRHEDGRIRVENVPPEEYLVSPDARPGRAPAYEGHRTVKTRSELIEMGFDADVVASLSSAPDTLGDARAMARYRDQGFEGAVAPGGDPSREAIEVHDEYVLVDWDGDGVAELRRVVRCGSTILLNEEAEEAPFATLCPIPMPHKLYGLSLADQTRDLQRISTVLWRQMLDNLYLSNNPDVQVSEAAQRSDGSTIEALAISTPGRIVPVGREPLVYSAAPFVADKSLLMLDRLNMEIESRTGVSKAGQGIDPDTLSSTPKTATEIAAIEAGRNARVEMIARIFAETGVKSLFRKLLKLVVRHQPRARLIRLRNAWVPIDPRDWDAEMDVQIVVGLGMGNQASQIAAAQAVLAVQRELAQSPFAAMVTPDNVFAAVKKLLVASGTRDVETYVSAIPPQPPAPPAPPKPDAGMLKAQADSMLAAERFKAEQAGHAAKLQLAQEEAAARLQMQRDQAALDAELQHQKQEAEAAIAYRQQALEAELAERRMVLEESMAARRADLAERGTISRMRPGGALDE